MTFKTPAIYLLDCSTFWKVVVGSKALVTYVQEYRTAAQAENEAARLQHEMYPSLAIVRAFPEGQGA